MNKMNPVTMTVNEMADTVGISRCYAYRLISNGSIPVIRLGRKILIRRDDLEKWLEEQVNAEG